MLRPNTKIHLNYRREYIPNEWCMILNMYKCRLPTTQLPAEWCIYRQIKSSWDKPYVWGLARQNVRIDTAEWHMPSTFNRPCISTLPTHLLSHGDLIPAKSDYSISSLTMSPRNPRGPWAEQPKRRLLKSEIRQTRFRCWVIFIIQGCKREI